MDAQVSPTDQQPAPRFWVSLTDRRSAVESTLRQNPALSDRRVAAMHGVSREMVGRVRDRLIGMRVLQDRTSRVGRDGKTYNVKRNPARKEGQDPTPNQQVGLLVIRLKKLVELAQSRDFTEEYAAADMRSRANVQRVFIELGSELDRLRKVFRPR